ncbi:O-antigen ligase family protein [Microbacterium sp. Root180]|uniref:O-antigen ligase family protein n=1 Tax=Microbacterium sp. Root180 TaxID=1736483 RepID=UPI0006F42CF8|nr:O-antigen ligase family protein [Microbacterium sp. Root180]KRB36247.1 hypothetical protein ASD93_09110 [Microbacterium sp. Root180]
MNPRRSIVLPETIAIGAARVALLATLAYFVVLPVGHTAILSSALALAGISALTLAVLERRRLAHALVPVVVASAALMVLGFAVGFGNPGWQHSLIAWVGAPVLFWIWSVAISEALLRSVLVVLAWATIALSAVMLVAAAIGSSASGALPTFLRVVFDADVTGSGLASAVGVYGASSLIALTPMWLMALFFGDARHLPPRVLVIAAAVLSCLAALLSTRRASLALAVVAPVLVGVAYLATRDWKANPWSRRRWVLATACVAVAAVGVLLAQRLPIVARTLAGIGGLLAGEATSIDERLRLEQVQRLWEGFLQSPVWGHGIGATIDGYARNDERAWAFEMQYHLLLFQTGALGAILLIAIAVTTVLALWRAQRRRPDLRPVLAVTATAALAVALANAVNPILQAPGHFWALFLVIGVVNSALVGQPAPSLGLRVASSRGSD